MTKEQIKQEALKRERETRPASCSDLAYCGVTSSYGLGFVEGAEWMKKEFIKENVPYTHAKQYEKLKVEAEREIVYLLKEYARRFEYSKMIIEVTKMSFGTFNKETNRIEIDKVDYDVRFHHN